MKNRCTWAGHDPLYVEYHDQEWGVPVFDDKKLFECLVLESAQAGLSWITILRKRENYRKAFSNFNASYIARYDRQKIDELLTNPGIIRNRMKIEATVNNAKAFLAVCKEFGSFTEYSWQFVGGKPIQNKWTSVKELPVKTEISDVFSKDLKKRGFKFIGSTIVYAHMQAVGMVNDHTVDCFRYQPIKKIKHPFRRNNAQSSR